MASKAPHVSRTADEHKTNKIQVSNNKQPIRFYVNLAKKMLKNGEPDVELSGLGNAINTVVTCVEILKNALLVDVKKIETSSVQMGNTKRLKPKLRVFVVKSKGFDAIIAQQEKDRAEKQAAAAAQTTQAPQAPLRGATAQQIPQAK